MIMDARAQTNYNGPTNFFFSMGFTKVVGLDQISVFFFIFTHWEPLKNDIFNV